MPSQQETHIVDEVSTGAQERREPWISYLDEKERIEVRLLVREAADIDDRRRQITSKLSLFRQRCSKRRDAMARKK